MKPNIICSLTPDAVALLQLVKGRTIDFQKIGAMDTPVERARDYLNGESRPFGTVVHPKIEGSKRGSGKYTANGATYRQYRKGQYMGRHALVTLGPKPVVGDSKRAAYFKAIAGAMTAMTTKSGKSVLAVRRDKAIEAVRKVDPGLKGWGHSGAVSALYKIGALKIVV